MSEPSQTISLNDIGMRYIGALQHLSDLMVLTWAGANAVDEQSYNETFRSVAGLPSTPFRFPLETARQEAARWWFKNSLGEVLGLCLVFLEDIRRVCGLVAFNVAKAKATGDLAALAAEVNAELGPLDLPARFAHLKNRYALKPPLEAEMMSLAALHRCFLQTGGTVPKGMEITVQLKSVEPPTEGRPEPRLTDYSRTWTEEDRITISRAEHAAVFTTASVFLSAMLAAVQEFAKASGLPEISSPQ
jgi:hypothetical protein